MPGEPSPSEPRSSRGPRRDIGAHAAEWAGNYVYGDIATLVVLGTLIFRPDVDPVSACGEVIVGAIAVWLAHGLSGIVTDWARGRERLHVGMVAGRLERSAPIVLSSLPAAAVIALAAAGIWSTSIGLWLAEGAGVVSLAVIGVWIAATSHERPSTSAAYVIALVGVGALIVSLEISAHYL